MTIVVYRDGVIASDSAIHLGNTRLGSVRKIARGPDGSLGGAAGDANSLAKFVDWIRDGEREPFGQLGGDLYPDALIVRPSGALFYTGHLGTPYRVTGVPWLLVGCGATVALGALHMGATAKEAVKAAIRWDSGCAGDIQILTLGKPKR